MVISMLKIRRPLGRLIFNMGIAIPGKTVFLIETAPRYISFLMFNIVNNQSSAFAKCWNLECYSAYHDCRHLQGSSEAFSISVKIVLSQDLTVWKPQDLCSVWSYCSKIWHAPQWHWASERREILQYNILWFLSIIENRSDFIWLRNW